jgi:hypothetical protein
MMSKRRSAQAKLQAVKDHIMAKSTARREIGATIHDWDLKRPGVKLPRELELTSFKCSKVLIDN